MKNKTIILSTLVLLFIIILLFIVLFWGNISENDSSLNNEDFFGDTTEERPFSFNEEALLETENNTTIIIPENNVKSLIQKIHSGPIAGFALSSRENAYGKEDILRFIDGNTGYISEVSLTSPEKVIPLLQNTLVRIKKTQFHKTGEGVVFQYTDTNAENILTFAGRIEKKPFATSTPLETGEYTLLGKPFSQNLNGIDLSFDQEFIFYALKEGGGSTFIRESLETGEKKEILKMPLEHITLSLFNKKNALIYTNPSILSDGVLWDVDLENKNIFMFHKKKPALIAKGHPEKPLIVYSYWDTIAQTSVGRIVDKETGKEISIPFGIYADKCVWGYKNYLYCAVPREIRKSDYLDKRQKGLSIEGDVLWRFDFENESAKQIVDPLGEMDFDMRFLTMQVQEDELYILFKIENDDSLWRILLPEEDSLITETEEEIE
jgi:hypothetical protein